MRVVYLHQYFTTPEYSGGVRSYQIAKRLVKQGHDVNLVTSTAFFPVKKSSPFRFVSRITIDGIHVHAVHAKYGNKMSFPRRILAFLFFMLISTLVACRLRGCDVVYASSTPLTIGVPGLIACVFHRAPLVFEVRDLWPDVPIAMGIVTNPAAIKVLRWFEMLIYRRASKIVALSIGMERELVSKGVPVEKITVVPNASDMKEFDRVDAGCPEVECLRQNANTKICLYAGTFGYVNNLDYLVELARCIKEKSFNIRILLVGDGVEKESLVEKIRDGQLDTQIRMADPVSKQELIAYIKSVDACFSTVKNIPALFNNSANKFFDSLAAGKPIIINHGGWQADVIRQHALGLVLDCGADEGATRLERFFVDEGRFPSAGKIRAFAQENYSRDLLFDKLFHDVLEPLHCNRS